MFRLSSRGLGPMLILAALACGPGAAHAQAEPGVAQSWVDDLGTMRWEAGLAFAGITAVGVADWDWGSSRFHFHPEGWFGRDTGSGGTDKLGHAFSSYGLTNLFADKLMREGRSPERAALSAALTTQALMLYVEAFDGVSGDHGFAREDVVMNLLGTGLAAARITSPRLRELVDYRMEYWPSGYKGFRPLSDYAGQKYLLAWKLGGLDALRDTPLRYLELQTGYYARGFSDGEYADGRSRVRRTFVGIGVNLAELFFGRAAAGDGEWRRGGRFFLEHIQLPGTAVRASHRLDPQDAP